MPNRAAVRRAFCSAGKLGPRYGEAAALRRRSVNLLARRLTVEESLAEVSGRIVFGPTKTHAMRKLPLPPSLAAALERHLDERVGAAIDALLFTSPKGKPLRYGNFMRTVWKPTLVELGLPDVGIHVLRHSAAAAMIRTGASPTAVQRILGHRSAAFTLTVYGHIFDADLDAVAESLDLPWGEAELQPVSAVRKRALPFSGTIIGNVRGEWQHHGILNVQADFLLGAASGNCPTVSTVAGAPTSCSKLRRSRPRKRFTRSSYCLRSSGS